MINVCMYMYLYEWICNCNYKSKHTIIAGWFYDHDDDDGFLLLNGLDCCYISLDVVATDVDITNYTD